MKQQTVTINGIVYDSQTGNALHTERGTGSSARHSAHTVHMQPQKSKTLNRRYVKQPAVHETAAKLKPSETTQAKHQVKHAVSVHRTPTMADVRRSNSISRFASTPTPPRKEAHYASTDVAPTSHPLVKHVQQHKANTQPVVRVAKPSDVIKREAIEQATSKMPSKHARNRQVHKQKQRSFFARFVGVGSASLAVLVLGAYLTYLNMPAISTRVAATQAGVNASYPGYQPMGYSLDGAVAYKEGSVSMKFAANGGPESYTLAQTKSGWDSSALLENSVKPAAGSNYSTTTANGLTIYTYGNTSEWVNNGVLYTISGSAVLSNSQIQRIATSL